MGKLKGKSARLYVDHEALYLRSFEMSNNVEAVTVDTSVYGDDFDQFDVMNARGRLDVRAFMFDDYRGPGDTANASLDEFFYERLIDPITGQAVTTPALLSMTLKPSLAEGDPVFFTQGYGNMGIAPNRAGMSVLSATFTETGRQNWGKILRLIEVTLTDGSPISTSTSVDLGVATNYLAAGLHVIKYTVNTGTVTGVTAKIQSDDAAPMSSATDRITFATVTSKAKEYKEAGALAAENFHRVVLTGAGTGTWSVTVGVVVVADVG